MSALMDWLRERPAWRLWAGGAVAAAALVMAVAHGAGPPASPAFRDASGRPLPSVTPAVASPIAPATAPGASASGEATVTPAASPDAKAIAQALATARAFLGAYLAYRPGDTPASLRSRLRPYDTDQLDAALAQGGADGTPPSAAALAVGQLTALGPAPDGRLVVVAQAQGAGTARYFELYLAPTPAGWRVAEVAS